MHVTIRIYNVKTYISPADMFIRMCQKAKSHEKMRVVSMFGNSDLRVG